MPCVTMLAMIVSVRGPKAEIGVSRSSFLHRKFNFFAHLRAMVGTRLVNASVLAMSEPIVGALQKTSNDVLFVSRFPAIQN